MSTTNEAVRKIVRTLAAERSRRSWTQERVATACGSSGADVSRWENGITVPSSANLARWATALGYSLTVLLGGAPQYIPVTNDDGRNVVWMHACGRCATWSVTPTPEAMCGQWCKTPGAPWVQLYRKATAGELG